MSILAVDSIKPRATGVAVTVTGDLDVTGTLGVTGDIYYDEVTGRNINITGIATVNTFGASGIATVGILTAYESITVKVGAGSTELATAIDAKASTGKAIAMAMVFG